MPITQRRPNHATYQCRECSQDFQARYLTEASTIPRWCSQACKQRARYWRLKAQKNIEELELTREMEERWPGGRLREDLMVREENYNEEQEKET